MQKVLNKKGKLMSILTILEPGFFIKLPVKRIYYEFKKKLFKIINPVTNNKIKAQD